MDFLDEFLHLRIQLEEIKLVTDDFSANNEIGNGGFGKVYKGEISHSKGRSMVAFKRLDRRFGQGDPQFWKEIMMLSRHSHENLISLLGYCDECDEKILVYELASRGSLDHYLSDVTLTWRQRLKICLAAAKGLSYLHDPKGTQQRVIHHDIKSSNILLDGNWNAKLSDMGLSKLSPANQQHTAVLSNVVGTPGYCDPMYMETYMLTKESDVYSFGVVLFEVMCGKLCYEYSSSFQFETLVPMWKESYEQKKLDEIIFRDLEPQMDPTSLEKFSDIAYQCLRIPREERPSMARIVKEVQLALEFQDIAEGLQSEVEPRLERMDEVHVLKMLEKSLSRELELEKKLIESKRDEEDLKVKLRLTEQAAEAVWGRFLEAENAAVVLMGVSRDLVAQHQLVQLNLDGLNHQEDVLRSKINDNCIKLLNTKDSSIEKLNSRIAQLVAENLEVTTLREKVKSLEEKVKESESNLKKGNASNQSIQEHVRKTESTIESLKENSNV